jgi:8-oxo-dGTP pyrophosphatase MutT (NUDIX family)
MHHRFNRYDDIEIDVCKLDYRSPDRLSASLDRELRAWADRIGSPDSSIVWLRVPVQISHVVPWLLGQAENSSLSISKHPFRVHHATHERGFMLSRSKCEAPLYGTHYARVECVVIEEGTGNLLVIREKAAAPSGIKLVTGSVDPGEYLGHAAEREVMEETGVRAGFVGTVGLGHRLKTRFDKDEILVGCVLQAPAGQVPTADRGEVSYAAWARPEEAAAVCNPMAREWLSIVSKMRAPMMRATVPDFRGHGHTMELHATQ